VTIVDDRPTDSVGKPQRPRSRTKKWMVAAGLAAGAAILLLTPLWAPVLLRQLSFFSVRHVEVVGVRYVDPAEIVSRLQVDTLDSVWDDTDAMAARVREHPLVRSADIDRKLPGTIVVRLVEHVPVALVGTANGFRPYDAHGVALPIDPAAADVNAPILDRADPAMLRLLADARLRTPALYGRISEIRRGGAGGSIVFVLDSLPVHTRPDITLERLSDIELVEQDLARRRLRAAELDLRFRDQVIARLP
jgi:cell division protein FtsQ